MSKNNKRTQTSPRTLRCRRAYGKLNEAVAEYGPQMDADIRDRVAAATPEPLEIAPPSHYLQLALFELEHLLRDVVRADEQRNEASIERSFARKNLEKKKKSLAQRMRHVASAVEGAFGDAGCAIVPFREVDTVEGIRRHAEFMERRLLDFPLPIPKNVDEETAGLVLMPPPEELASALRVRLDSFLEAQRFYKSALRKILAVQVEHESALQAFDEAEQKLRGLMKSFLVFTHVEEIAPVIHLERRAAAIVDPPTTEFDPPTHADRPAFFHAA